MDNSGLIRIVTDRARATFLFYDGIDDFNISADGQGMNISIWFTTSEIIQLKDAIEEALEKSEK